MHARTHAHTHARTLARLLHGWVIGRVDGHACRFVVQATATGSIMALVAVVVVMGGWWSGQGCGAFDDSCIGLAVVQREGLVDWTGRCA